MSFTQHILLHVKRLAIPVKRAGVIPLTLIDQADVVAADGYVGMVVSQHFSCDFHRLLKRLYCLVTI